MFESIQKKHMFEEIATQIQEQIRNGSLKEGDKLPGELELCQIFQVSRSSIREAIKSLQTLGILEARTGQGTYVSPNAKANINSNRLTEMITSGQYRNQILEIRYMIEPQASYFFAQTCTSQDIDFLKDSYNQMLNCTAQGDMEGNRYYGNIFHKYIIDAMHNSVLSTFYITIQTSLLKQREDLILNVDAEEHISYDHEHKDLIYAFEHHNAELARSIMENHIGRQTKWRKKED